MAPAVEDHVSLAPVEYVAAVVVRTVTHPPPSGHVFNVFGNALPFAEVVAALGVPVALVPLPQFVQAVERDLGNALNSVRTECCGWAVPLSQHPLAAQGLL